MNRTTLLTVLLVGLSASVSTATTAGRRRRRSHDVNHNLSHRQARRAASGAYRLSIVVPAFREAGIGETVRRLRAELPDIDRDGGLEIVVVDDGSGDRTAELARGAGADQVLSLPVNRGKGAAVRAGMLAARGRVIAFTDADLSYSPDQVANLLVEVESGWDVVVGTRDHASAETLVGTSLLRRAGHRLIALSTRTVLVGRHSDTQAGLKAFRADVARRLFARTCIDRFAFDVELFHLIELDGLSVHEVPVQVANSDTSTVRVVRDAARLFRDLARIWLRSRSGAYNTRPTLVAVPTGEPTARAPMPPVFESEPVA